LLSPAAYPLFRGAQSYSLVPDIPKHHAHVYVNYLSEGDTEQEGSALTGGGINFKVECNLAIFD